MQTLTFNNKLDNKDFVVPSELRFDGGGLKTSDRCDMCGAQAYMHVMKDNKELFFCGHHGRAKIKDLIVQNWLIDDQTIRLIKRD